MKKYKAGSFCFNKENNIYYTDDFSNFYKENDKSLRRFGRMGYLD